MNHHHHVHLQRFFLQCVPLSAAIHFFGILDLVLVPLSLYLAQLSRAQAAVQELYEMDSLSGISFSSIYTAFECGLFIIAFLCYLPRALFYGLFLLNKRIKRLHWYLTAKSASFFVLCFLGAITLVLTFVFSTLLTDTLGTGLAYMITFFMVPVHLVLGVDLYLCIMVRHCLEERIWLAQPKVKHQRKATEDLDETTEILETPESAKE